MVLTGQLRSSQSRSPGGCDASRGCECECEGHLEAGSATEASKEVRAAGRARRTPDLVLVLLVLLLPGCCWFAKRNCFPPCDPPRTVVVTTEQTCELPPQLVLNAVKRTECPGNPTWACYEPLEGGKLAANLSALKTWIREARARCGPPASLPTSRPAGAPASAPTP